MSIKDSNKKPRVIQRITREMPPMGSEFVGRFRDREYSATVIAARSYPSGKALKVGNTIYSSLSSAAKAITGWPTNGWLFWKSKR